MDLSIARYTYTIAINSVKAVSASPPIISITGQGLGQARSIFINDLSCRFEVESATTAFVEVPASVTKTGITSISAEATGPVAALGEVAVSFSFEELATTVTGISALVQRFLKVLVTTKGTSFQSADEGGGILSMVALADGEKLAEGMLVDAVTDTETYFKEDPKFVDLDPSERLLSAEVLSSSWDRNSQTASISIQITNQLGETLETGVSL
ncbi:MAG: hypothetical protein VXZ72_05520 [Chlamydiota bacterium]|nr:hypothetical protein [Chlamydiota bacterium]